MHRLASGGGIAPFDGVEDAGVVLYGGLLADPADGAQATGDAQLRERIEDEAVDQVAASIGDGVVGGDVGLDSGRVVRRLFQLALDPAQRLELFL